MRIPDSARGPLRRGVRRLQAYALGADPASRRLLGECVDAIERGTTLAGAGVEALKVRPLRGQTVWIRRGSRDHQVAWDTFVGRYHLPPRGTKPRRVLDLGAHTGLTTAHMAAIWPAATIIGVELDAANAALARRNVAAFGARCTLVEAAAWPAAGTVSYQREGVADDAFAVSGSGSTEVAAITVTQLLDEHTPGMTMDYAKLDVEGAEAALISNGGWLDRVATVKVEVHPPYSVDACVQDLRSRGFRTSIDRRHWSAVIGTRQRKP